MLPWAKTLVFSQPLLLEVEAFVFLLRLHLKQLFTVLVIIFFFSSKASPLPSHLWRNVLIICPGEMKVSLIQVE